jgi:inositol transporter-like SP family MFS transporter
VPSVSCSGGVRLPKTTPTVLVLMSLSPPVRLSGAGFCGESIYKVWSQELFPTLLRSTAQGVPLAFARVVAGLAAFGTPAIATGSPTALFAVLVGCAAVSGVIGLIWVPRLSSAADL